MNTAGQKSSTIKGQGKIKESQESKQNKDSFSYTDLSFNSVILKWENFATIVYELSVWQSERKEFQVLYEGGESSFVAKDLNPNTNYKFRLRTKLEEEKTWIKEYLLNITTETLSAKEKFLQLFISLVYEKSTQSIDVLKNVILF
jgi:hypothetical protein